MTKPIIFTADAHMAYGRRGSKLSECSDSHVGLPTMSSATSSEWDDAFQTPPKLYVTARTMRFPPERWVLVNQREIS